MKAMIFAAGLGTRLRPLTEHIPKAMVEVGGKPMLQIVIERCILAGIREMVINVHYLPHVITDFLESKGYFGITIHISDESDLLLETGGGLWKARHHFNDGQPFLVANADVLTNIDIRKFQAFHKGQKALASLAVRDRSGSRKLLFDENGLLKGRSSGLADEQGTQLAFSGYHVIDPEIFHHPTRTGIFSITDWYLDLCGQFPIAAYRHDGDIWVDVGNMQKLEEARSIYQDGKGF